jgi:hypothetical protein
VYTRTPGAGTRSHRDVAAFGVSAGRQRGIRDVNVSRGIRAQFEPPASDEELSKLSSDSLEDDNVRPWMVVTRKKSKALCGVGMNKLPVNNYKKGLTSESETVVAVAGSNLPGMKKERICKRYAKENEGRISSCEPSSIGEGGMNAKQKTLNRVSAGAAEFSSDESDEDAKHTAVASQKSAKKKLAKELKDIPPNLEQAQSRPKTHVHASPEQEDSVENRRGKSSSKLTPMSATVARRLADTVRGHARSNPPPRREYTPASQIAPGSYLAKALRDVRERSATQIPSDPSDDSSSSSPSSSSDSEGGDSKHRKRYQVTNKGHRQSHSKKAVKCRKKRRDSSSKSSSFESRIKPKPPKDYDDARSFLSEGTDYVISSKISLHRRVFVLSYHLKGKAYDFYTQQVSMTVPSWTLENFFKEMFNYCFPIDYREKQRKRLEQTFQDNKAVSEYNYKIEEICNMIGMIDERQKVSRFWHGLRKSIHRALWRDWYNPETSSWNEV